jgi:hypothetical protein
MSDFISRMAARAVGVAPAAQPRAASPFAGEPQGELVEFVDEAVAARTTPTHDVPSTVATPSTAAASPGPDGPPSRAPSLPEPAPGRPAPGEGRTAAPTSAAPAHSAQPADTPAPVAQAVPPRDQADLVRADEVPAAAEPPASTELVRVATAVPAARSAPATPAPAAQATRQASSPAAETARPVRVHIGRLEVRASLHREPASAAPPRAARAREEPALSLADYLRGGGGTR